MNLYLLCILLILIGNYALSSSVNRLNIRHLSTQLPREFEGYYDAQHYRRSQQYLRDNTRFGMLTSTAMTIATVVFIVAGGFSWIDTAARSCGGGPILTGLVFVGLVLLGSSLLHIPFSVYATFVIEEHYGFNKTTPKTFALDILKVWLLTALIGGSVFAVVLWFFETAGPWAWLYCWCAVTAFQIFFMCIAPVVIMPLFNRFVPLTDGELKQAIEGYARSQGFAIKGVFTMDGSRRSAKSNAFFTGFGRFRRIVLFDTLIEKHSIEELVAIVGHEVGHYKKRHILQHLVIAIATNGCMFFILSCFLNNRGLFDAFGMQHLSIYASFVFFGFLYAPIEMLISFFSNMLSRKNEYQADRYAAASSGRPEALIEALKKLSVDNLSNLTPHPLKVLLSYSHPPVLERIKKLRTSGHIRGAAAV
ncbi:M48 family metallopeptidase [Thermodesulfobacteriota bacterium]